MIIVVRTSSLVWHFVQVFILNRKRKTYQQENEKTCPHFDWNIFFRLSAFLSAGSLEVLLIIVTHFAFIVAYAIKILFQ